MRPPRKSLLFPGLSISAAAIIGFAFQPPAAAQDPNVREVSLVRQDFSDCSNGNVQDKDPSLLGGTAVVARGNDGTTHVKVGITAKQNTKYHFFLKCVRLLGDIQTGDEGVGIQTFEFPTNSSGDVYAFDMYPEGAPAGDKYQSVQVKY